MSRFFDVVPYILAAGAILLGAFEIVKDWKEYKTSWLRMSVSLVFIAVAALSIVSLRHDSQEKKEDKNKAEGEMKALQAKADTANQAQTENTKMYVESFTKMSGQISDLKTEVKTEALQKKLDAVQAELLENRKAMAPGAKAELTFTFVPYYNPPTPNLPTPVKDVTVPLQSDGSIHVEFSVLNLTAVDAMGAEADFYICDGCKYAKEQAVFRKLPHVKETVRLLNLHDLHALQATESLGLDIVPPSGGTEITIGFSYRCHTCALHIGMTPEATGTVHIERP
jgi:hypothetical protein